MSELTFIDYIPDNVLKDYFSIIEKDDEISVCLIEGEVGENSSVYIEVVQENPHFDGIIKVFLNTTDVRRYGKTVSYDEKISIDKIKRWTMKYSALVDYMVGINKKRISNGLKGIRAVATIIHNNKLVNIDTIYTPEKEFQN